jgi:hypothetical protein
LPREFVECNEVVGKTVSSLKVYDDPSEDCEVVIEFTDGTTFSCAIEQRASMKSVLFRGSVGTPEILRDYNP